MPVVAVEGYGIDVEAKPEESILGALCRRGYTYKFGCRRGGCGVCKVRLVSGRVDYPKAVAETVLSAADRHDGVCLTCRAVPVTDVVIRLDVGDRLRSVSLLLFGGKTKPSKRLHAKGIDSE